MESDKKDLLERSRYKYHFSRMVFFNRNTKKMFSREFIDDHTASQIRKKIKEETTGNQWIFYFNRPLSDEAKQEILSEFGE